MSEDHVGKLIAKLGPRQLAKAVLSPWAIAAGLAVTAAIVVSGGTLFGLTAGAGVWIVGIGITLARSNSSQTKNRTYDRVDPFAVGEPWRRYVQSSQAANTRFATAVDNTQPGPLRDRLAEIGERINEAAQELWVTAKEGHALTAALRELNTTEISSRIAAAQSELLGAPPERKAPLQASLDSALARQQSAQRLSGQRTSVQDRLRELDGKLDELSARGVELALSAASAKLDPSLDTLRADVDNVILEMEALRQAMIETATLGNPPCENPIREMTRQEPPPGTSITG